MLLSVAETSPIYFPKIQSPLGNEITFEDAESDCPDPLSQFIQTWSHLDSINFQVKKNLSIVTTEIYVFDQSGTETLIAGTVSSLSSTHTNYKIPLNNYKGSAIQIVAKANIAGTTSEVDRTPWMKVVDANDTVNMRNRRLIKYYGYYGTTDPFMDVFYGASLAARDIEHSIRIHCVLSIEQPEIELDQYVDTQGQLTNTGSEFQSTMEARMPFIPSWLYRKIGYIATYPYLFLEGKAIVFNGAPRKGAKISGAKWLYECQLPFKIKDTSVHSY